MKLPSRPFLCSIAHRWRPYRGRNAIVVPYLLVCKRCGAQRRKRMPGRAVR